MNHKTVKYLILDTETATLPFVNDWELTAEQKKDIAIARPLVYDIGWTIATRKDGILERKNFLVAEIYCVPSIFNTAYYKEKRPIYEQMLRNKEVQILRWDEIMEILLADLRECNYLCAYNAMFDFKKAIPFTECYIRHLYGGDYTEWENGQKFFCEKLANGYKAEGKNQFDAMNFNFRGESFPLVDIWGQACYTYINTQKYRKTCLKNGYLTNSGTFFKTSAEVVKRYLDDKYDFIESHTALDDAIIETEILFKCLRNSKRIDGIKAFPFRELGDTVEFIKSNKGITEEMFSNTFTALKSYVDNTADTYESGRVNGYKTQVLAKIDKLLDLYMDKYGNDENAKGLNWGE